jgi:hypothetical protein
MTGLEINTVRCPFSFELYTVVAYDKVLRAIDENTKKERLS